MAGRTRLPIDTHLRWLRVASTLQAALLRCSLPAPLVPPGGRHVALHAVYRDTSSGVCKN